MTPPSITPVILTGGSGTRLWPLSRAARPKQFLPLTGAATMLEQTIARVAGDGFDAPLLVGGAAQEDLLQLLAGGDTAMILEPEARNTAPAIALAALVLPPDAPMLVMPSDHVIADVSAFQAAIGRAAALAAQGWLVTFGIASTGPETGYGYIEQGDALDDDGFRAVRFVEKPDRETAQRFLDTGGYHWNGGIFLFTAGRYLEELDRHAPDILTAARAAFDKGHRDGNIHRPDAAAFGRAPAISIDYAIMEKAERVAVVPVAMGWSDVGSWDALHEISAKDASGNSLSGDTLAIDTTNSLILSDGPKVTAIGVEDLIVVATKDAILVVPRGESQRVKEAVDALKTDAGGNELL
ncbi:MAG: mannose-1-phosphate guanylyltransferase/mannose-6-phosphate isomerase [Pseudomonadota bacterium]